MNSSWSYQPIMDGIIRYVNEKELRRLGLESAYVLTVSANLATVRSSCIGISPLNGRGFCGNVTFRINGRDGVKVSKIEVVWNGYTNTEVSGIDKPRLLEMLLKVVALLPMDLTEPGFSKKWMQHLKQAWE
ncbi:MAG: hypothetical protein NT141_01710 [candidate division WWE3 bacterium]|nr:hypothetical protein [candidate division WWE3 bacterium]